MTHPGHVLGAGACLGADLETQQGVSHWSLRFMGPDVATLSVSPDTDEVEMSGPMGVWWGQGGEWLI